MKGKCWLYIRAFLLLIIIIMISNLTSVKKIKYLSIVLYSSTDRY